MRNTLRWVVLRLALFIGLVVAIGFYQLAWPEIKSSFSKQAIAHENFSAYQMRDRIAEERDRQQDRLKKSVDEISRQSTAQLNQRLAASSKAKTQAEERIKAAQGWLNRYRPSKILERTTAEIEVAYREREIEAIRATLKIRSYQQALKGAKANLDRYRMIPTQNAILAAREKCRASDEALEQFDADYSRPWLEKGLPEIGEAIRAYWQNEREALADQRTKDCSRSKELKKRRDTGLKYARVFREKQVSFARAQETLGNLELPADFSGGIARSTIRDILLKAVVAMTLIIAMPYLIRILFYYGLAPMAERRGAIRLKVPGGSGAAIPPAARSTTSIPVRLGAGEELLVRQSFLQSTSLKGTKTTQWCLNWRYPLSSIASGMIFLTRVRGDGEITTISAVHDPLAEVTEITLPEGASCVLQPRALAAVIQPIDRGLRITSHWRLGTLNAWLTLQLRYFVFHGPARLVIKGSRGVRVERAESGRIFGQDQLTGFSVDLAYSVTRTETFWPYFFGREQLLKDKVGAGEGILIIEEAPQPGNSGAHSRRGLEGAFDAMLKAFGL